MELSVFFFLSCTARAGMRFHKLATTLMPLFFSRIFFIASIRQVKIDNSKMLQQCEGCVRTKKSSRIRYGVDESERKSFWVFSKRVNGELFPCDEFLKEELWKFALLSAFYGTIVSVYYETRGEECAKIVQCLTKNMQYSKNNIPPFFSNKRHMI